MQLHLYLPLDCQCKNVAKQLEREKLKKKSQEQYRPSYLFLYFSTTGASNIMDKNAVPLQLFSILSNQDQPVSSCATWQHPNMLFQYYFNKD